MKLDFEKCIKDGVEQAMKECELTIGMTLKEAVEKQIPKKPIHKHEEYDKHDWYKNSDGTVDDFHFEFENHSGVQCKRCGETVCTLCYEDYDKAAGKCVIDEHRCPQCNALVSSYNKFCHKCGQALDWSDTE